jgi:ribose/xylose/arabinose/galactoside ABC-type transport system permease subunit
VNAFRRSGARALPDPRALGLAGSLAALGVCFSIASPAFASPENLALILRQVSVNGILAVGMTFAVLTGGVDLSVGSLLAIAGLVSALFAQREPSTASVALAIAAPLGIGLLGGLANGALVAFTRVPPLIATLGTLTAYRGFAVWFRVNPVYDLQPWYRELGRFEVFGLPLPALVFFACAGIAGFTLGYTRFGRHLLAVGGNAAAARAAGVEIARVRLAAYAICGVCAGLAALVSTARLGAAQSVAGQGFELQAIAAVVVGGASLAGGRGRIRDSVLGALLIGILFNGLVLLDVPSPVQQMLIGAIIVAAVALDTALRGGDDA